MDSFLRGDQTAARAPPARRSVSPFISFSPPELKRCPFLEVTPNTDSSSQKDVDKRRHVPVPALQCLLFFSLSKSCHKKTWLLCGSNHCLCVAVAASCVPGRGVDRQHGGYQPSHEETDQLSDPRCQSLYPSGPSASEETQRKTLSENLLIVCTLTLCTPPDL
ncbi:uncharacterized protein V6R79_001444 [Siganus canaliculatus]